MAHLSEQNNTEDLAYQTLHEKIGNDYDIIVARQNEMTEIIKSSNLKVKEIHNNLGPFDYTLIECVKNAVV